MTITTLETQTLDFKMNLEYPALLAPVLDLSTLAVLSRPAASPAPQTLPCPSRWQHLLGFSQFFSQSAHAAVRAREKRKKFRLFF